MGNRPIVRKCVCTDTTFETLLKGGVQSMKDIEDWFGCGLSCGLCRPYLERMLATGETEFEILDTDPRAT